MYYYGHLKIRLTIKATIELREKQDTGRLIFPESLNLISLHHVADGLTDCSDSKCCSHPSCRTNIMCMYLEDPVEVLLRKPPPAVDAPFLKRVQFLFEGEDSVQNYAKQDTFDDRYVVDEIPYVLRLSFLMMLS